MMPRSEGQALLSWLMPWGFDGAARIGDHPTIPGAAGMSETQVTRPACGPRRACGLDNNYNRMVPYDWTEIPCRYRLKALSSSIFCITSSHTSVSTPSAVASTTIGMSYSSRKASWGPYTTRPSSVRVNWQYSGRSFSGLMARCRFSGSAKRAHIMRTGSSFPNRAFGGAGVPRCFGPILRERS